MARRTTRMFVRVVAALLAALAAAAGCSASPDGDPVEQAAALSTTTSTSTTTTTVPAPTTTGTTSPPTTTTSSPLPLGPGAPATATCPAVPLLVAPDPARPTYRMEVRVLDGLDVVEGSLTVGFTPDLPTDRLVFRLWPNGPRPAGAGARLDTGTVTLDGAPALTSSPDPTTLVVAVPGGLRPGQRTEATVPWRLKMPGPSSDRLAHEGDTLRLGSFFPILAWEPGVGWATDPPTALFAEASSAPTADFRYAVAVPAGFTALASGVPTSDGYEALAVRDVAVSVGRFRLAEGEARAPAPVRVTVGVAEGLDDDPAAYLDRVVRSLEDLAGRFGPYPYATYTLAITPGLRGGIEYPTHVMQGPATTGRTTPHEVAHQWFYSLVGNDQGRDPVLDEGLATWAEARIEGNLAALAARPLPEAGRGRAGEAMAYWESRSDAYYRSVYVQGAEALAAFGDSERVDCALRLYAAANAFSIATTADLLDSLRSVFPDADAVLASYGLTAT